MLSLEYDVPDAFKKYNLTCYFYIESDCYRMTLLDSENHPTMMFIPKPKTNQSTEIVKHIIKFAKDKNPELFL